MPAEQSSVKTFHARRGRMTTTRAHILENVLPKFELPAGEGELDLRQILNSPDVIVDFVFVGLLKLPRTLDSRIWHLFMVTVFLCFKSALFTTQSRHF
ncbi:MAG: hypothetical protein NTW81_06065 [Actinobacteria bacterium]|nr:hypothetical protein [Actinomycetota bacterium]